MIWKKSRHKQSCSNNGDDEARTHFAHRHMHFYGSERTHVGGGSICKCTFTHKRKPCIMHAHELPNITKTHIKTSRKDSRWLLKRQERKTERRRRDALPAIKDAEEKRQREKKRWRRKSLLLISRDPKFRQAHTEARAVPVGLGP